MAALSRLTQKIHSTPRYHFATMTDKRFDYFLQVQNFWLTVNESDHIDAKNRLHAGLRIQIVKHNIADFASTQLYDYPHTILIRLIA